MGNAMVVTVIVRFDRLKNATNYILMSLATADLTVSFLVMIPMLIYHVQGRWPLSDMFCKFFNAFDISCCTASILHLLLVSVDRYVAIFNPLKYRNLVRKWHVTVFVVAIWALSLTMSFVPIFMDWHMPKDFNTTNSTSTQDHNDQCGLLVNMPYAIISSSLSFFIPLIIMIALYLQIYIVARRQANAIAEIEFQSRKFNSDLIVNNLSQSQDLNQIQNVESRKMTKRRRLIMFGLNNRKRTKDTKAIKTLGFIMGIFILCWLPFFITYLISAIYYEDTEGHALELSTFTDRLIVWIGYANSFINPVVYALTNRDFKKSYLTTIQSCLQFLCPTAIYMKIFDSSGSYICCRRKSYTKANKKRASLESSGSKFSCCCCCKNSSSSSDAIVARGKEPLVLAYTSNDTNKNQLNQSIRISIENTDKNDESILVRDDNNNFDGEIAIINNCQLKLLERNRGISLPRHSQLNSTDSCNDECLNNKVNKRRLRSSEVGDKMERSSSEEQPKKERKPLLSCFRKSNRSKDTTNVRETEETSTNKKFLDVNDCKIELKQAKFDKHGNVVMCRM